MANMKALAKDTAIYGMSSILGRFLNYLLVPMYTRLLDKAAYGEVTNLYGYTALLLVILTFGMETTFFRFANQEEGRSDTVFTNGLLFVGGLTAVFLTLVFAFISPLSHFMHYEAHPHFILMMATVTAIDVMQALPFCYLRFQKRAVKFASLKMLFILLNTGLNLLYFVLLGQRDVAYVFILNLVCSAIVTFFFVPDLFRIRWQVDGPMLRRMFHYSWPLFVLGIAGILNQTADKIIFPLVYPYVARGKELLGIYGGCVKIAMIMALITQAFRYAYEPIVFAQAKDKNKNEMYALGMKYFLIFTLLAFLAVVAYLPILQNLVGPEYREGIGVVPIVMVAEIMMGIYFNLSFWYKLIDRTLYGAWFSLTGCAVLLMVNLWGIPHYGYMACAWGGVAGYGTAMVMSYVVGQRKYPIPYPMRSLTAYVALAALCFVLMWWMTSALPLAMRLTANSLLLASFTLYIIHNDLPLSCLPLVGKHFRR